MNLQFRDLAKPGVSLGETLHGLARGLVQEIEKPAETETRIHDIRVGTKKIQGLLRLSGRFIKAEDQEAIRNLTRSIRTAFAGQRDEEVLQQRLGELFSGEEATAARLSPAPVIEAVSAEEARARARQLEEFFAALDLSQLRARELAATTTAAYRKARKLMRSCRKNPNDEEMHTWRKRVKDVSYQSLALADLPFLAKRAQPLDDLADLLGEYHDLAVLLGRLDPQAPHTAVVARRKKELHRTVRKLAAKLFSRPPARFAKKLGRALRKHSG